MFGRRPPPPREWLAAARERLLRVEDTLDDVGDRLHPDLTLPQARAAVLGDRPDLRRSWEAAVVEVRSATDSWHASMKGEPSDLVGDLPVQAS